MTFNVTPTRQTSRSLGQHRGATAFTLGQGSRKHDKSYRIPPCPALLGLVSDQRARTKLSGLLFNLNHSEGGLEPPKLKSTEDLRMLRGGGEEDHLEVQIGRAHV